jgi:hypothetical protein
MYKFNKETLLWELDEEKQIKYNFFKKATIGVVITFLVMVLYFNADAQKQKDTISYQAKEIKCLKSNLDSLSKSKDLPLTLKTVDWLIDQLPFKDKNLIKQQYRLESDNLKSKLVMTNKNLLGMRNAGKRPQPGCKSTRNDYRHYDHWIFSIFDRYIYEIYNGTSLKGYAEDKKYFDKLKIKK